MTSESAFGDEAFDVEVHDSRTVFDGLVWDVRRERFGYGDGELTREYVHHPGAAAVVAIDELGRILLIQQYRHPIRQRDWELPAGLLDVAGEEPREAAIRELAEEADVAAGRCEPLVSVYSTPGGSDEIVHIFLARQLTPIPQAHPRDGEERDIRVAWVPLAEALAAITSGKLRNAILVTGVFAAARHIGADGSAGV